VCAGIGLLGWGVTRGTAQEEQTVGRYEVAVPDLVLDTATGKLTSKGQVLEQPIDPSNTEIGRYSVDGFVTALTRRVGLDLMNQPVVWPELVKGYVIIDTKTGQILKQRTYYSRNLQEGDL
jgi:hypothetical protein